MKDEYLVSKLLNKNIIGTNVHFERIGENLSFRMKRSKYRVTVPVFPNSDISYLTGVIVGDGNITLIGRKISKYPRTQIKVFNSSRVFTERINDAFKKIFNCRDNVYKKKDKNCYFIQMNNKIIWSYFVNIMGLMHKKKINLKIPKILRTKELLRYFIAGLWDTDGYYTKSFGIMLNGSHYDFLKDIKNLSKKFYDLDFCELHEDEIEFNGKLFQRVQMNLSKKSKERFKETIPLNNEKWWAE